MLKASVRRDSIYLIINIFDRRQTILDKEPEVLSRYIIKTFVRMPMAMCVFITPASLLNGLSESSEITNKFPKSL